MARIILIGKDGQLGWELQRLVPRLGECQAFGRAELDLADPAAIAAAIRNIRPQWIINAGAYTNVDRAEDEPEKAFAVNGHALAVIGEECRRINAYVIHYSTDYVFDGRQTIPYGEADPTGPVGVYGASKLAGERALLDSGVPCLIFRTAWLYGTTGKNFVKTILRLALKNKQLRIVDDQWGSPTWAREVAAATIDVALQLDKGVRSPAVQQSWGVYNMVAEGQTTWKGFAERIVQESARRWGTELPLRVEDILGISAKEYAARAPRPARSVLSPGKLKSRFGISLPLWQDQISSFLETVSKPASFLAEDAARCP